MNPQKFKEWLLKIDNAHIEKPAQNARLNKLSAQIQQLSIQVHHLLRQKECAMTSVEDGLNKKTSQLLVIQSKSRQRLNAARNKIQKQKEIKEGQFKTQVKLITQLCDNFSRKGRQFVEQIRKKNLYHLQILASELQNLRQLRSKFCQSKQAKNKSYQIWMEKSIRRADIIIESQEKDLMLIEEYEKELMSRCDAVQKQFELKLEAKANQSQRKQKLLFQKLELLISNIDVE